MNSLQSALAAAIAAKAPPPSSAAAPSSSLSSFPSSSSSSSLSSSFFKSPHTSSSSSSPSAFFPSSSSSSSVPPPPAPAPAPVVAPVSSSLRLGQMDYNDRDALGLGVAISSDGTGNASASGSEQTASMKVMIDANRRAYVATIIAYLASHRSAATPTHSFDALLAAHNISDCNTAARDRLMKDLRANTKVFVRDSAHIAFKPTHRGMYNKADLERYINQFTNGIPKDELDDAYTGVNNDIDSLLLSGVIHSIIHIEKKNRVILFPISHSFSVSVDSDLKDMWNAVVMPKTTVDLEERLHAAGHLSDAQWKAGHLEKSKQKLAAIQLAAGQKIINQEERRKNRKRYPQKMTNEHLKDDFDWRQSSTPAAKPAARK